MLTALCAVLAAANPPASLKLLDADAPPACAEGSPGWEGASALEKKRILEACSGEHPAAAERADSPGLLHLGEAPRVSVSRAMQFHLTGAGLGAVAGFASSAFAHDESRANWDGAPLYAASAVGGALVGYVLGGLATRDDPVGTAAKVVLGAVAAVVSVAATLGLVFGAEFLLIAAACQSGCFAYGG